MAQKKFFTKEVKIGLSFVIAFALLYWGLNFLKGVNLFTPTNHYYLQYDNLEGLVVSNGVFIKGHKVGQVREIQYDFTKEKPFTIDIIINKDITLPKGTIAYLFDESMLGGKGINIEFTDSKSNHNSGDTLISCTQPGLFAVIGEIVPTLHATISHADSLINSANSILNSSQLTNSLNNFETITGDLKNTSSKINNIIDNQFPPIINNVNAICNDVKNISGDLKLVSGKLTQIQYQEIVSSLDTTITNLQDLTNRINSPNGTIGLLLNNKDLYLNLNSTVTSANNLLIDLKNNPKRYVHFSVFGAKDKKKKDEKK